MQEINKDFRPGSFSVSPERIERIRFSERFFEVVVMEVERGLILTLMLRGFKSKLA